MNTFFRIVGFARPIGSSGFVYFLLILGATVFGVINLTALIPLLQILFEQTELETVVKPEVTHFSLQLLTDSFYFHLAQILERNGRLVTLYYVCTLIGSSVLLANFFRYASQIILAKVRIKVIRNLRNAAFGAIMAEKMAFFTTAKKGDLISRIMSDVQEIEQSVVSSFKIIIKDPLMILGYFVALFVISWELTIYTLVLVPITGFGVSLIARRIKRWSIKSQQSLGRIGNILDESISGMRVIKGFGVETYVKGRFSYEVDQFAKQTFQIAKKTNLASPISEVVGTLVVCVLLILGGGLIFESESSLRASQFIGFLVIFSQTLVPAKSISVALSQINRGLAAGDRVFELIDQSPKTTQGGSHQIIKGINRSIAFDKVSFAYEQINVLNGVSFEIPKGKVIALVGASGSGKTTIADLLCRFYNPKVGNILVDGLDLEEIHVGNWLQQIGIVSQQPILFHDTVANNISFGTEAVNFDSITKAAIKANAHEFIMQLPKGYDTMIGEMGMKLSGGERQRITIARAILRNAPLLILDEATSSLDAKSEEVVHEAIRELMIGKTTLMITHNLNTVKLADEILVLDQGRIIERGTHESLLAQSGLYRQLTELQSF